MKNGYQPKDDGKPLYPPTTGSRVYSPKYGEPMTFQEAYERIQDDIKILARKNGRDIPDVLFVASVAIEKQIPKKLHKRASHWGETRHCPTCWHEILHNQGDFCSFCGQRLERSKE